MNTRELVLLVGIPASGKTTFYRERFFPSHVYVSLDQLGSRATEYELLLLCLSRNRNIVVDNTNVTIAERKRYIKAAHDAGVKVVGFCFVTKPAEAMRRNAQRKGKSCVPNVAIATKYKRLEYPRLEEGFDELNFVRLGPDGFMMEPYDEAKLTK